MGFLKHDDHIILFLKDESPIRTIDLLEAMHAIEDFCDGKKNCFRLAMPTRMFYFVANSPAEAKSWIEILQWKIVSLYLYSPFHNGWFKVFVP